jgi:endonuclease YncB( thermonuclease family)
LAPLRPDATLVGVRLRSLVLPTLLIFPLACGGMHAGASPAANIARVLDGDTIVLTDGRHVRLVQLDAPETDENECYAAEAKGVLIRLLPFGTEVEIETDPALDKRDRFGRILAYVERDGTNINLELVREGAASPYFFHADRGRYAADLLKAANEARQLGRGLWVACSGTALDPLHSVQARS